MELKNQRQKTTIKLSTLASLLLVLFIGLVVYNLRYRADVTQTENIKAFPSCEGFGCYTTTGGRGGPVYPVTNLNDSGEGSLRWAVSQGTDSDSRIVVFNTAGVIELSSALNVRPNTTIAGQTATGDGIAVKGTLLVESNTILRYLRIRPGEISDGDAIEINGRNIIIDHCSISWANDEAIGFKRNQDMGTLDPPIDRNVTIQWSILGEQEKGILAWFAHKTSIHHNLFAHHDYRSPNTAGGEADPSVFDVVNNVVYDVSEAASQAPGSVNLNYVNNYTIAPRDSRDHVHSLVIDDTNPLVKIYAEGNVGPHTRAGEPAWNEVRAETDGPATESIHRVYQPYTTPQITTQSAEEAFELVLNQAGANKPTRDPIDTRIVDRVRTGTYSYVIRDPWMARALASESWLNLNYSSSTAPEDSDNDGLPDYWEISKGLNPNDRSDSLIDSSGNGYTNIEEYTFEITGEGTYIGQVPDAPIIPNSPPQLVNPGDKEEIVGEELSFSLEASDEDDDELTFSSDNLPDGAQLDPTLGLFSWIAESDQLGSHIVSFSVSDGQDSTTESITITIKTQQIDAENLPPVLEIIDNYEVMQGEKLEFSIKATDPDDDPINYSSNTLPSGAFLNFYTGEFSWIPTENQKGDYLVSFDASDGELFDTKTATITVKELPYNSQPVLSPIDNKTIEVEQALRFKVEAYDADGDELSFSTSELPDGAIFNKSSQEFSWTPTASQTGTYFITFRVADEMKGDYQIVQINVLAAKIIDPEPAPTPAPDTEPPSTPTPEPTPFPESTPPPTPTPTPEPTDESTAPISTEERKVHPINTRVMQTSSKKLTELSKSPEEKQLIKFGIDEVLFAYKDFNLPSNNLLEVSYYHLLAGQKFDPVVKVSTNNAKGISQIELSILKNGKQLISTTLIKSEESSGGKVYFLSDESISIDSYGLYQFYLKVAGNEDLGIIKNCLVDPAGYIYYKNRSGEEVRISGARVTLEKMDDSHFSLWNAQEFGQINPQITLDDGNYSFLVPSGTYRLIVEKDGYKKIETEAFQVEDQIVIMNLEMEKKPNLFVITMAIGLFLIIVLTAIWMMVKRRASVARQFESESSMIG